jgi:hypothetical protein
MSAKFLMPTAVVCVAEVQLFNCGSFPITISTISLNDGFNIAQFPQLLVEMRQQIPGRSLYD